MCSSYMTVEIGKIIYGYRNRDSDYFSSIWEVPKVTETLYLHWVRVMWYIHLSKFIQLYRFSFICMHKSISQSIVNITKVIKVKK